MLTCSTHLLGQRAQQAAIPGSKALLYGLWLSQAVGVGLDGVLACLQPGLHQRAAHCCHILLGHLLHQHPAHTHLDCHALATCCSSVGESKPVWGMSTCTSSVYVHIHTQVLHAHHSYPTCAITPCMHKHTHQIPDTVWYVAKMFVDCKATRCFWTQT